MNAVTTTDLRRRFHRISAMIDKGESVAIMRRGKLYATLVPCAHDTQHSPNRVDFRAQAQAIWKGRIFPASEVAEMRAAELEGEEG